MTQPDYQAVCFEAVMALDNLTKAFKYFLSNAVSERNQNRLSDAAKSEKDNFEDLPDIIKRVSNAMREIIYDQTGDTTNLSSVRKKVDELGSIMHIGRSYPTDAVRRAKTIATAFSETTLKKKKKEPQK